MERAPQQPKRHVDIKGEFARPANAGHRVADDLRLCKRVDHQPNGLSLFMEHSDDTEVGGLDGGVRDQQIVESLACEELRLGGAVNHEALEDRVGIEDPPDKCRHADRLGGKANGLFATGLAQGRDEEGNIPVERIEIHQPRRHRDFSEDLPPRFIGERLGWMRRRLLHEVPHRSFVRLFPGIDA